jgi:tetratricopeptide (TPR) repeat protein
MKKKAISIFGIVILLYMIVSSTFLSGETMKCIENPQIGDFYIVNKKKLGKTPYAINKEASKMRGFQIFQVMEVDDQNIILNYNSHQYLPYSYAIEKMETGAAYAPDYYEPSDQLKIPRNKLFKLHLFNIIKSVHRTIENEDDRNYKVAMTLCENRKPRESGEYFSKIREHSLSYKNYEELAGCLYDAKLYDDALKVYTASASVYPDKPQPFHMAALCYAQNRNFKEAVRLYNKAIEIAPGHSNTYANLASIYGLLGDTKNSLKNYRISIDKNKISKTILINYMEVLLIEGEQLDENIEKISNDNYYFSDNYYLMNFEMLKILFLNENNINISDQLSSWDESFNIFKLRWNFDLLDRWATTESRKNCIDFFKSKK